MVNKSKPQRIALEKLASKPPERHKIDGTMVRRMVQAVVTVLVTTMDGKGFFKRCEEVLQGSTVARKWKSIDAKDQLLLFDKALTLVRPGLGKIKNHKRKSVDK